MDDEKDQPLSFAEFIGPNSKVGRKLLTDFELWAIANGFETKGFPSTEEE